jgi:Uma2 family endonuclease
MKAVLAEVPEHFLAWRKTTGADRYDEMWDGVLHMGPMPNRRHQQLEFALQSWLHAHWAPQSGGKVYHQINLAAIGGWTSNYRVPDLVLLLPDRFGIDHNEYFEGAPSAVVEIRSPNDETYEKLPFYARLGVPEVWIFDRDSRQGELHQLVGDEYRLLAPDADGWLSSVLGVEFRAEAVGKLGMRLAGRHDSQAILAEE